MEPGSSWTLGKGRWEIDSREIEDKTRVLMDLRRLEPAGWDNIEKENDAIGIKLVSERCQIPIPKNLPNGLYVAVPVPAEVHLGV